MFRTLDVIMIAALIGAASWTFKVKSDSETAMARVARLEKRLQIEREAIDILNADWSLLTSPDRLEKLVERYREQLPLTPAEPAMIGTLDNVPMADEMPVETGEPDEEFADAAPDRQTVTGSTERVDGQ
ncbi:MAG: hypothetical protein VYD64_01170 [Pseudomonadota bacterium]|nr:hypothetical protein [Pseudomonadota bacterium]